MNRSGGRLNHAFARDIMRAMQVEENDNATNELSCIRRPTSRRPATSRSARRPDSSNGRPIPKTALAATAVRYPYHGSTRPLSAASMASTASTGRPKSARSSYSGASSVLGVVRNNPGSMTIEQHRQLQVGRRKALMSRDRTDTVRLPLIANPDDPRLC